MAKIYRFDGESFTDYFVRLYTNKDKYHLSHKEVADLLNAEVGQNFDESKWRKEFAAFERGMRYAEKKTAQDVDQRILCISDLHIPFNLPVETFANYAGITDVLLLNGDITDCQAISKFPKTYRISPMEEIIQARCYMMSLIELIRPKKVIVNYGNHDIRFQSYLAKNLDTDIMELMPETSLELILVDGFRRFDKLSGIKLYYEPLCEVYPDIEIVYTNSWFCQVGKTIFCHPIAFSSGALKTAQRAVQYFRNEGYDFTSLVLAHTHRVGFYKEGNTMMYEQGCCCESGKMTYVDGKLTPSQKEGFIYIAQDSKGELIPKATDLVALN